MIGVLTDLSHPAQWVSRDLFVLRYKMYVVVQLHYRFCVTDLSYSTQWVSRDWFCLTGYATGVT